MHPSLFCVTNIKIRISEAKSIDLYSFYQVSWLYLVSIVNQKFDPGEDKCLVKPKSEGESQKF